MFGRVIGSMDLAPVGRQHGIEFLAVVQLAAAYGATSRAALDFVVHRCEIPYRQTGLPLGGGNLT